MRWNKSFEGTLHIYDADLQKMAKMLGDVNIKECPYFDLSDRYGNSARYYRGKQWIPCSERLPEVNGRYFVTRGLNACGAIWNRVYIINYSDLMGLKSERIWWDGNVGKSDFEHIDDVIAWMPLPESYEENKE